jgi:hypothetical protein
MAPATTSIQYNIQLLLVVSFLPFVSFVPFVVKLFAELIGSRLEVPMVN